MSSLDEVSFRLGEVNNAVKTLLARGAAHEAKTESIARDLIDMKTQLPAVVEKVAEMHPHVEDYRRTKRFGLKVVSVMTFVLAGAANIAIEVVRTWWR
ncbi:MAG: hypothetical protein GEV06_16780 [Luteitalea sp.]|nr:hypothetical protein [Luteitalea sp.]